MKNHPLNIDETYEFWFRKEYNKGIKGKKFKFFLRPDDRTKQKPNNPEVGANVRIRILDLPGDTDNDPVLSNYELMSILKSVQVKKIKNISNFEFENMSILDDSLEKILLVLKNIYNKDFTKDSIITLFEI